jgi:hypothetical protein
MSNHKLDKKGKRLREAIPREAMFLTLVSRHVYPKVGGLYSKKAIVDLLKNNEMKRTGDWERLIAYLKGA